MNLQILITLATLITSLNAQVSYALQISLMDQTSPLRVAIVDHPTAKNKFFVSWEKLPGENPTGAMVYRKESGTNQTRYFAVGNGGLFSIVDTGKTKLVNGTEVKVYSLIDDKLENPREMLLDSAASINLEKITKQYRDFENLGEQTEGQATIEASIASKLEKINKDCGTKISAQVAWAEFKTAQKIHLAKQTISVLEGLPPVCSDSDYKIALQKIKTIKIHFLANKAQGDEDLKVTDSQLSIRLWDEFFNPRETVNAWLKKNL